MGRKSNAEKRATYVVIYILIAIVGLIGGFGGLTYFKLPLTDTLISTTNTYYSYSSNASSAPAVAVDSALTIQFLELGNKYTGDCTFIQVGNVEILIDCGSKSSSIETVKNYISSFMADDKLDYVIVTHAHQDHYAGFSTSSTTKNIFDYFEVGTIIEFAQSENQDSAMYKRYVENRNEERNETRENTIDGKGARWFTALDAINAGENGENDTTNQGAKSIIPLNDSGTITLQILDQKYYREDAHSENDYSVCCMINQQGEDSTYRRFVFTGDLEEDGEESLLELNNVFKTADPLNVELYKAGHHGSKTSSSSAFISKIAPKKVCVCCCAGSSEYSSNIENQFPTKKFMETISPYTTEVYVTSRCVDYKANKYESFNGNIAVSSVSSGVVVNCSNNNTVLKDSEWFKQYCQRLQDNNITFNVDYKWLQ